MEVMIWHGCCRKLHFCDLSNPGGVIILPKTTVPFLTLRNMTPLVTWFGLTCISGNILMRQQTSQSPDRNSWVLLAHCHQLAMPVPTESLRYSSSTPLYLPCSVPWIPSSLSLPTSTHSLKSSSSPPFLWNRPLHPRALTPSLHWRPSALGGKQRLLGEWNICQSLIAVPDTQWLL